MPRSNLRLYVICPGKNNHLFGKVLDGAKKAQKELEHFNVKVEYLYTNNHSVSRQAQLLSQAIDLKPDGIALAPASITELNLLIDEAVDSGIPVVTFNDDAPYSKRLCYVGPDNYASGRLCGELIGNFLSGKGRILILSDKEEGYGLKQRLLGFRDKIKTFYPEVRIAKILNYAEDENACCINAAKELTDNEDINGIFTTSYAGSTAIGKILKTMNFSEPPKVVGYDPGESVSEYVREGLIQTLIYQDPFSQGYLGLKVLYDYLSSGTVPKKENLYTKFDIVMRENLDNFIKEKL